MKIKVKKSYLFLKAPSGTILYKMYRVSNRELLQNFIKILFNILILQKHPVISLEMGLYKSSLSKPIDTQLEFF